MQDLPNILHNFTSAARWLIAYSGGVDSHVLLHCLAELKRKNPRWPELIAVHINHQLQDEANQWQQHCQQQCDQLGLPLLTRTVSVNKSPRQSLEEQAREARYQAFSQMLNENDVLMLGHHQDDQVETFFLRLLRGSGSTGMSAMPNSRPLGAGQLLRPLLTMSRQQIVQTAREARLQWIEDPSNQSDGFDRNFLRLKVLPLLPERWPNYQQTVARCSRLSDDSRQLVRELAQLDAERLQLDLQASSWSIEALQSLSAIRAKNLLRFWLSQRGLAIPSEAQLQAVMEEVIAAREDADPLVRWGHVEARRFAGELIVMPALAEFNPQQEQSWQGEQCSLPGSGKLSIQSVEGSGLKELSDLSIRFRQGGERCQPVGRGGSQTLKKLFQEYRVPTWLRDRVPLIYSGDQLVAVAGYWVCEGFQAKVSEAGWLIQWQSECYYGGQDDR
jgi:tRNA(Ile)-lysidine synthase